jgi:RHS repeat-associated protein
VVEAGENDITYDYYYNESWQVLEVRKGGSANSYEQYVWGAQYIDAPVVRFQDSDTNGTLNNTLYYTYDAQFNVTALIEPDGDVVERYVYDPYGKVTFKAADWSDAASQAKSAYDNEILYCGYRFNPESGNYIARNRYLTPPLGRWLTTDPIGYGDGMNLYEYVRSQPLGARDDSGLFSGSSYNSIPTKKCVIQPQYDECMEMAQDKYNRLLEINKRNFEKMLRNISLDLQTCLNDCYRLAAPARQICIVGCQAGATMLRTGAIELYTMADGAATGFLLGVRFMCNADYSKMVGQDCPCPKGYIEAGASE